MKSLSFWLFLFLFSGCKFFKPPIDRHPYKSVLLNAKISQIEIEDLRKEVSDKPLKIPRLSMPKQLYKAYPVLDVRLENFLRQNVKSYFTNQGNQVRINIKINDAFQQFSATETSESEYAKVDLQIEIYDYQTDETKSCTANGFADHISRNAQRDVVDSLYIWSFKKTINKCLDKLQ